MNLIFFQISEVETIGNFEFAGCDVYCFKSYILMYILHFSHCRVRTPVGVYKTVAKEVTVAGRIYTEIASVCPIFFPVFVFLENTLIYPVPNISTLKIRILIDSLPLSPQVSGGVTHSVRIFGRSYRAVTAVFADTFQPIGTRILRNIHIGVPLPLSTFVVNGACHDILIRFFQP